jgi:hypothetical protein
MIGNQVAGVAAVALCLLMVAVAALSVYLDRNKKRQAFPPSRTENRSTDDQH